MLMTDASRVLLESYFTHPAVCWARRRLVRHPDKPSEALATRWPRRRTKRGSRVLVRLSMVGPSSTPHGGANCSDSFVRHVSAPQHWSIYSHLHPDVVGLTTHRLG